MATLKRAFIVFTLFFVLSTISFFTSDMGRGMLKKIIKVSTFGYGAAKKKDDKEKVRTPPIYPPRHLERISVCNVKLKDHKSPNSNDTHDQPTIFFITPTYTRSEQIAELTRLGQTLLHVKNLHWVIAEDSQYCSKMIFSLVERLNIPYTHLTSPMPEIYKNLEMKDRPRGVSSRRAGLQWVLDRHNEAKNQSNYNENINKPYDEAKIKIKKSSSSAVVYFGDDDNT